MNKNLVVNRRDFLRLIFTMVVLLLVWLSQMPKMEAGSNPAYDAEFMVSPSSITNISNNGGHYGSSILSYAIDGTSATHWETGTPNSNTFKNQVTFTFDDTYTLARIEYIVRQGADWKGFPLHYKLYISTSDTGENFTLLKEDTYVAAYGGMVPIEFSDTDARRVRFEFVQAHQNWASIAEISFYKPDPFLAEFNKLFTDKTYSELNPLYSNEQDIQDVIDLAATYPNKNKYLPILDDALTLLDDPNAFDHKIYTAEQRGQGWTEGNRAQMDGRESMLPTGYYVTPGETITVYLEADSNGIVPNLIFGQALTVGGNIGHWKKTYPLTPGINYIKAPDLAVNHDDASLIRPAPIYLENQAYPHQQDVVPKIRLIGGTKFPMYVHGVTDPEDFMDELANYVNNVEYNDLYFDYDSIINSSNPPKYYNIMELVTDNTITTTSAKAALDGLNEQYASHGYTIEDSAETWERFYRVMNEYSGFDENDPNPLHHEPSTRFMSRLFNEGPHAWAGYGLTGYQAYGGIDSGERTGGFAKELAMVSGPSGGWGEAHEWGHLYDNWNIEIGEVTNNLYSLRMQREFGIESRLVSENRWHTIQSFNEGKPASFSVFEETAIDYQLEIKYGLNSFYPLVNRYLREESLNGTFNGLTKWQVMAVAMSQVAGVNLTPHFTHYNIDMSHPNVAQLLTGLPLLQEKTWLLTDKAITLDTFVNDAKPLITSVQRFDTGILLNLSINEPANTVLAYEVYRDDVLIGITYGSTFLDQTAQPSQVYNYKVIAYDGKAFASPESKTYSIEGNANPIFNSTWTFTANPVAQWAYPLSRAFDKNTNTFFESEKIPGNKTITVDMKDNYYVTGFSYVARPYDSWNVGMMTSYNLYTSLDGVTWAKVIDEGIVPNPSARGNNYNSISLPVPTLARYVKLESLSVLHGDNALTVAELSISGTAIEPTGFESDTLYRIVSKNSNKVIGVPSGNVNDLAQATQQTYSGGEHQIWNLIKQTDGSYKIVSLQSDKVLDVTGASTANGASIIQYTDNSSSNQKWIIEEVSPGYYKIISQNSGKALDVNAASMQDGASIIQYTYSGSDNQLWSIEEIQ